MTTFLIAILIISILVFVHEFGHFIAARILGVKVEEFGFGFPPRIFGWQKGDTVYSINWIPLGGFVRLKGESGEHFHHHDSFAAKNAGRRAIIVVAGVLMNFLLAVVIFTGMFIVGMPASLDEVGSRATVRDAQISVGRVLDSSPAATAGLEIGDVVISLDNQIFETVQDLQSYIREHDGRQLEVKYRRGSDEFTTLATPSFIVQAEKVGIGVGLVAVGKISYPWYLAPIRAMELTYNFSIGILQAFWGVISGLITQGRLTMDVAGPVGIAVLTGHAARLGISYLLQFLAILSINLGIINFLPIPALDGGRLLFLAIEKVRGRPAPKKLESIIHQIGFILLLTLVAIVTFRDVARVSGGVLDGIRNLF